MQRYIACVIERPTRVLAGLSLGLLGACDADHTCIIPPCVPTVAVEIAVRATAGPGPLAGAFVITGVPSQRLTCNGGSGATCYLFGEAGRYDFDVGAAGYQSVSRSVTVSGTSRACGCPQVNTERIEVVLSPAP